ncbi:MAG: hypothetical protein CFE24_14035 [Flavobacterium sp. BFFFF2]|nr:MAG: hypothetical protein CFE24_14035 [Flavobacterium sp. BFFFF2]
MNKLKCISILFFILIASCKENDFEDGKVIQKYVGKHVKTVLYQIDYGAFGSNITLCVFNKANNELLEEIGLRGEDELPKVDSIVNNKIFIHYNFSSEIEGVKNIPPDGVLLGEALIDRSSLKFEYVFTNVYFKSKQ